MMQYLTESSSEFDLTMMKVQAVCEAAQRQLVINHNAAEIKVMQESGTDDDLRYLYEAADKSYDDTMNKAIDKIINAFTEYYHKMQSKVINLVRKKETTDVVDKIEKQIKMFPLLGKKSVIIENTEAQVKACDEYLSKLAKLKAKAKSGQTISAEDVSALQNSFSDAHGKVMGVASSKTVKASAAFTLLKSRMKSLDKDVTAVYNAGKKDLEDLKKVDSAIGSALARAISTISKQKMDDLVRGVANINPQLKKAFGKADKEVSKDKDGEKKKGLMGLFKKESTDDSAPPDTAEQSKMEDNALSDAMKEEAPVDSVGTDPIDSFDKLDAWGSVIDDLAGAVPVPSDECGTECGTSCEENATDTFDTLYKKIFGDAAPNPSDDAALTGGKPNNDKMIADLYKDVMAEVRGKNPEVKPAAPLKEGIGQESVYESLMKEIESLK